ncbi:MAG: IS1182 family transposase [Anaerolineae bacterium]|nr:IS1182 family transposase [Anaerolineae bacterium]
MALLGRENQQVPEDTARVARAAFPKGNKYMKIRDELGALYADHEFAELFPERGRPAESPGSLALVTVIQFAEGLSDRQAAEAVRSRIDIKYALALELTDAGFDYSLLSQFRGRLLENGREAQLLDSLLQRLSQKGLVKAGGQQRTDSTHVLAAIRQVNRLECVGETIRQVLNELARQAPDWLLEQIRPDWFDRYGPRFEMYRLPRQKAEREALQRQIGADGAHLLAAIYAEAGPRWLRELPAVEIMRQIWIQQYYVEQGQVKWRPQEQLPPNKLLIQSPYDVEARNRTKRDVNWTGYTAHLTETCDEATPNLITNVETTPATTGDVEVTPDIHTSLAQKELLPGEHFVDTSYVKAQYIVSSRTDYQIDLVGPVPPDSSWQAQAGAGFDIPCFAIDWHTQTVTCPEGHSSQYWRPRHDDYGNEVIDVSFAKADCLACACRVKCTKGQVSPRVLRLRPQPEYEALHCARQRQKTDQFKQRYKKRAGIEGTISQATRSFDLRRSRYIGLAKTHLQHVATAAAINLTRLACWLMDLPTAQTRRSSFAVLAPVT